MDNHISLLIGTGVGLFAGWVLCWMYFVGRIQEIMDDTKAEARKKLDNLGESVHKKDLQLDDSKRSLQLALEERNRLKHELTEETARKNKIEEKAAMLPFLEQKIKDLEARTIDFAVVTEKLQAREAQFREMKSTLEEKVKRVEGENSLLNRKNAELAKMAEEFSKLTDVKSLYEKALEENGFLRQQHFVRSFMEIKRGIDQTISAYNRIYGMFDKKMLTESEYPPVHEILPEEPSENVGIPEPPSDQTCGHDQDGMDDEKESG